MNFHTFIPNNPQVIVQLKDEWGKECATEGLEPEKENEGEVEVRRLGSLQWVLTLGPGQSSPWAEGAVPTFLPSMFR